MVKFKIFASQNTTPKGGIAHTLVQKAKRKGKKGYIYIMKKAITLLLATLMAVAPLSAYSDHRGRNVDSLEAVVAAWTPESIAAAPDSDIVRIVLAWEDLMEGFLQINGVKSEYYARKVLAIGRERHWYSAVKNSAKIIGQHFWAKGQYDSAAFYYGLALDALARMDAGSFSPTHPEGYSRMEIDDGYSSLYGTLGNLYNMTGSLDTAFAYYAKAGEIFDRYGWNESNAVLHYNMGETWLEEGELDKARERYEAALRYGRQAGDSLWIANPLKGLGALYLEQGRTRKGLRCLEEADRYFSIHEDQEFRARLETLDFMGQILREQRTHLRVTVGIIILALLLLAAWLTAGKRLRLSRKEGKETGEVLEEALAEMRPSQDAPKLSERELEILKLFASGMTGPQIAEKVFLSPETVKWHRKKLLVKFDAANTPELISKAKDSNLI